MALFERQQMSVEILLEGDEYRENDIKLGKIKLNNKCICITIALCNTNKYYPSKYGGRVEDASASYSN
jgi:hypothetical protein